MKNNQDFKIDKFEIVRQLGIGAYGNVLEVIDKKSKKSFALKVIDKKHISKQKKTHQIPIEKGVLLSLQHQGIVKLYSTFQDMQNLYFQLEYIPGGTLAKFLNLNHKSLDHKTIQFYIAELVVIIEYLHKNGLVHRDLKPENILLDENNHLKLIDFATSKVFDKKLCPQKAMEAFEMAENKKQQSKYSSRRNSFVGTAEYMSPEIIGDKDKCDQQMDIWALGIILHKMVYGKTPFYNKCEEQIFDNILNNQIKKYEELKQNQLAVDLIQQLLVKEPENRINIQQIKKHKFFDGIQWDNLFQQEAPIIQSFSPIQQIDQSQIHCLDKKEHYNKTQILKQGILQKRVLNFIVRIYNQKKVKLYDDPLQLVIHDEDNESQKEIIHIDNRTEIKLDNNKLQINYLNNNQQQNCVLKSSSVESIQEWYNIVEQQQSKTKKDKKQQQNYVNDLESTDSSLQDIQIQNNYKMEVLN